ncbi:MAG: rhodoquinone biosynthesis methyltransferase RquA [Gammaproteobacteria bacterium]|nr:rhodoquinone biosynthesis methyltransferase RquA [Gammaproteobacteria bacterium]
MHENSVVDVASNYKAFDDHKKSQELKVPNYLQETYWWAYVHPTSVQIFERQWLVNLILWGNFSRLRNAALDAIGQPIKGKNLQVACVYGDFSQQMATRLDIESELHIVDVAPVQIENANKKLKEHANVFLHHQDSTSLKFEEEQFDNVVVFFLLHEQPETVRAKTVEEAMRVVKPGGKVIFVDYHRPHWANPFRYIMFPILSVLEPFALGVWNKEIIDWAPAGLRPRKIKKETLFGGLYQKVVMTR